MQPSGQQTWLSVHRDITARYVASLLMVAALSIVGWMLMTDQLAEHRRRDETIGTAGAQRMLSHQMAGLLAERLDTSDPAERKRADLDLISAETRFLASFDTLSDIAKENGLAAAASEQLKTAYFDGPDAVAAAADQVEQRLDDLRANRMSRADAEKFIAWMRGPLIHTLDVAVAAHKASATKTLSELEMDLGLDLGILLLVLVFEAAFVFAPMAGRLKQQTRNLVETSQRLSSTLEDMAQLASVDGLTGLSNRRAFDLEVSRRDMMAGEPGNRPATGLARTGILSFDLDWFKAINDQFGHAAGDAVLRAVGERVRAACRPGDMAARMGGDEFTVILDDITSNGVDAIANRIRLAVQAPVVFQGLHLRVGASIGSCIVPDQAETVADALHLADEALRTAKMRGKSVCIRTHDTDSRNRLARHSLTVSLADGASLDGAQIVFHPIINLNSGILEAAHVAVQWQHPDGEFLQPGDFLTCVRSAGRILELEQLIRTNAFGTVAAWQAQGFGAASLVLPVAQEFLAQPQAAEEILGHMHALGIDPQRLCIEISDDIDLGRVGRQTLTELAAFRAAGCKLQLQDAGTGLQTLSNLSAIVADTLKLDSGLIDRASQHPAAERLLHLILGGAAQLGLSVTAERPTTLEQSRILKELAGAGPRISVQWPALAADEFQRMLRTRQLEGAVRTVVPFPKLRTR